MKKGSDLEFVPKGKEEVLIETMKTIRFVVGGIVFLAVLNKIVNDPGCTHMKISTKELLIEHFPASAGNLLESGKKAARNYLPSSEAIKSK